ncbi:MAG: uridine kinase [Phototrophicaceae bacterium]|jgi:uridine kinase
MNTQPITIGIAGGTGSGKTTVSNAILQQVGREKIAYLAHDSYYKDLRNLPKHQRKEINFDHPDSLDTDLLIEHIKQLQAQQDIQMPIYDFRLDERLPESEHITARPVILIEGILILALPTLRELFDIRIYVDTDPDVRLIRRLQRDITERGRTVESVINQYLQTVRPMHLEFVEPSKRYADIIIPEGGHNMIAIDMITDRVKAMMGNS